MSEPIYTEEDMQLARNVIEQLRRELNSAKMMLWCAVKAAGGQIEIPNHVAIEARNWKLERHDTPDYRGIVFRCLE